MRKHDHQRLRAQSISWAPYLQVEMASSTSSHPIYDLLLILLAVTHELGMEVLFIVTTQMTQI